MSEHVGEGQPGSPPVAQPAEGGREPLSASEVRVLGCLIEKQQVTPDVYPLTLNSLRTACNQLTGRSPVVSYDEDDVVEALAALRAKGLARVVHQPGGRAPKHRHVADEAFALERHELSVLAVLLLRGPQTPGELRTRTERMHQFSSVDEVQAVLERLRDRFGVATDVGRAPGQKEVRWAHLLSGSPGASASSAEREAGAAHDPGPPAASARVDRVAELEERVAALEADLADLRSSLGALLE